MSKNLLYALSPTEGVYLVPIIFDSLSKQFMLTSEHMTYAMCVSERGVLEHLYFGPRLPLSGDLPQAATHGPHSSFDSSPGQLLEEYPAWGGMYYYEPCLKATFTDDVRDTRLVYTSHSISSENSTSPELVVVLSDPHYALNVHLHYRLYEDCDVIERFAVIENTGVDAINLESALSAAWYFPRGAGYRLTHLAGKWAAETMIYRDILTPGKKTIESRRGNTSHQANPWFAIDTGLATEDHGHVWFGALAWSGNWKIDCEHTPFHTTKITGGIHDFDFAWDLSAGSSFHTPAFIAGFTEHGFGQASRNLHSYQRDHVLPEPSEIRPVLYNSWEATYFDVSEQNQMLLAERAAALGVELFVLDDGWFGQRINDRAGLGDWTVNAAKFPHGLARLIHHVNSLGMQFGIWVEPEMVNADSNLYRTHPDWVYHFPTRPRTESRNQLVLNLANPVVKAYIHNALHRLLSENNISFIKWDMNRSISEPGWMDVSPQKQREVWVRHVQSLYEILSQLRAEHPHVRIESCSGGGGRIDLGMMRYTDQVWTSDNTDPYDRLFIQEGFSMAYTAQTMMCWVADSAKWVTNRETSVVYRFHSAMMGALGIGGDLLRWPEEDLAEARHWIAEYKLIRHVVQQGNQYRLLSPRNGDCTAVQYVSRDQSESVLFVLRHPQERQTPTPRIHLRGLRSDWLYHSPEGASPVSGDALMKRGVDISVSGDVSSKMVRFEHWLG